MTQVKSFIHGIYPRSETLAQLTRDVERKRRGKDDLEKQWKEDFTELVQLQKSADFDYLEDGKLQWQDIFRPIIEATDGFTTGALTRWFDNNTFYRQPIITGVLKLNEKKLAAFFSDIIPAKQWKVTLPSPFTLAKLTDDSLSFEKTLSEITEILGEIVNYVHQKGVRFVQFNEPYLPYHGGTKEELKLFLASLKDLKNRIRTDARPAPTVAIHFYFGDASPYAKALNNEKIVDIVGIDFYKTSLDALPKKVSYDIIAGILEGRNSLLEKETTLKRFINKIMKTLKPNILYLSNNSDLELLPEPVARKKIKLLGKLQKDFS